MKEKFSIEEMETLPEAYLNGEGVSLCLELLSTVCEVFDAAIASLEEERRDCHPFDTHPLTLEIRSEVIIPVIGLFDSDMFILNYGKFY